MGSRLTVAKRELAGLRAEKTILLAIGIQLFIAAFSSFLVVGLVSMYDPRKWRSPARATRSRTSNALPTT